MSNLIGKFTRFFANGPTQPQRKPCDKTLMPPRCTTTHENRIDKAGKQQVFFAPRRLRGTRCDAYTARVLRRLTKAYMLPSASASRSVLLGSGTAVINVRVDEVSFALPPPRWALARQTERESPPW